MADGCRLVDEDGETVRLRGVGVGNWALPEGYMWQLPAAPERPRQMERLIADLLGTEEASRFWQQYRERLICEEVDRVVYLAAPQWQDYTLFGRPSSARISGFSSLTRAQPPRQPGGGEVQRSELMHLTEN